MTAYLWFMVVLFALALIAGLRTKPGHVDKPVTVGQLMFMCVLRTALLAWTVALLVGCGGGDPEDDPDQPTPRVDCATTPELCK